MILFAWLQKDLDEILCCRKKSKRRKRKQENSRTRIKEDISAAEPSTTSTTTVIDSGVWEFGQEDKTLIQSCLILSALVPLSQTDSVPLSLSQDSVPLSLSQSRGCDGSTSHKIFSIILVRLCKVQVSFVYFSYRHAMIEDLSQIYLIAVRVPSSCEYLKAVSRLFGQFSEGHMMWSAKI